MINPEKRSTISPNSSSVQSKEQRLCTDALLSHEFDAISDEQWVAMCEQAAQDARDTSAADE